MRLAIVERMVALAIPARADELVVTTAATPALDLLIRALLDPGDVVLVERPTYVVPLQQFRLGDVRSVSVPGDEDGLDPVALEEAVIEHRPKAVYTFPTFQNPAGSTLSAERREALARIAERHGIWVIEDDPTDGRAAGGVRPGDGGDARRPGRGASAGLELDTARRGVFAWAELAEGWSTERLLSRALEHGMFFMPGQVFLADIDSDSMLRISISNHLPETIEEGLRRLAAAVADLSVPAGEQR